MASVTQRGMIQIASRCAEPMADRRSSYEITLGSRSIRIVASYLYHIN
jgi:hypothetical protein